MKKIRYGLLGAIFLTGLYFAFFHHPRTVTTSSRQAYEEFLLGRQAGNKFYNTEAIQHFEKAVALDSNFAMAYLYLGRLYLLQPKMQQKGEACLKRALRLAPKVSERERWIIHMSLTHSPEKRQAYLDSLLQKYNKTLEPHLLKAQLAMAKRDFKTAELEYLHILRIDPNYAMAYNMLGYITAQEGRRDEAIEYFKKYIFIAPNEPNPHDSLGELFLLMGRYDEAVREFQKALAVRPELLTKPSLLSEAIHYHLAKAYFYKGQFSKALQNARFTQKFHQTGIFSQDIALLKGLIFYQKGEYNRSLTFADSLKSNNPNAWLIRALNAVQLNRPDLLDACIEKARAGAQKFSHRQPEWKLILHFFLGLKAFHQKDYSAAIVHLKKVVDSTSDSQFAVRDLAWAYYQTGQLDSARAVIRRTLTMNPQAWGGLFAQAQIALATGDTATARTAMERYLHLYKDRDTDTPDIRLIQKELQKIAARPAEEKHRVKF